ncbi:MAG TPA: RES family NAD+ phosphorylase [Caulobacter sp.]|nr:RES family NAD+ phosphorylase [Caulobacter sp.]
MDGIPVVREAFSRTVRLVTSARLRDPVLLKLVEPADLAAIAEIEGATSNRLVAQDRGTGAVNPEEFVYGVPHAAFINASFSYAKPMEMNRFNGPDRGAWYAALEVETCLREVVFHMTEAIGRTGRYEAVIDYAEMFSSMSGVFLDLRAQGHDCLHPDPAIGYPAGNALAKNARAAGLNGIIYPSVRHEGGVCFAALWPHVVQSVAQGEIYRITWSGTPIPTVERIAAASAAA